MQPNIEIKLFRLDAVVSVLMRNSRLTGASKKYILFLMVAVSEGAFVVFEVYKTQQQIRGVRLCKKA